MTSDRSSSPVLSSLLPHWIKLEDVLPTFDDDLAALASGCELLEQWEQYYSPLRTVQTAGWQHLARSPEQLGDKGGVKRFRRKTG
jgi:hypothetical protein